ncbi:hypothetical protein DPMN_052670 [Dreissena polymorpha]|uniref:Protein kinase domain-containing protein n=1 Tax=Dreissena polymorpha TaxID=45954 RepID=A0A9D4CM71_DREPO|nr:hypothetical protein DPMN_052670 [Dreissena polymorpha]
MTSTTGQLQRKGSADKTIPHTRLEDETMIWEMYENVRKLGQGSFGKVYQVRHKSTNVMWAMKFVNKDKVSVWCDIFIEDFEKCVMLASNLL